MGDIEEGAAKCGIRLTRFKRSIYMGMFKATMQWPHDYCRRRSMRDKGWVASPSAVSEWMFQITPETARVQDIDILTISICILRRTFGTDATSSMMQSK